MARKKVPDLKAPKGRKQIALPLPWVVVFAVCGLSAVAAAAWDARACTAELEEAQNALMKILELERKYQAKAGRYAEMAPCSFTEDGATTCVSRIGFSLVGTSHLAYRVDTDVKTFVATAIGVSPRHRGSVVRLDQSGALDLRGAVCRE